MIKLPVSPPEQWEGSTHFTPTPPAPILGCRAPGASLDFLAAPRDIKSLVVPAAHSGIQRPRKSGQKAGGGWNNPLPPGLDSSPTQPNHSSSCRTHSASGTRRVTSMCWHGGVKGRRGETPSKELQRANSSPKGQVLLLHKQAQPCPILQPGKMSLQGPGACPRELEGTVPELPPQRGGLGILCSPS